MSDARTQRIDQLRREIRYLWRPEDRLLDYVQERLEQLAMLGCDDPSPQRAHTPTVGATTDDRLVLNQWTAPVEGEPA
jgi:hypothetical protein